MKTKINLVNIYYCILFLVSLVYGYVRIRFGAGWEIYLPLIFILSIAFLHKRVTITKEIFLLLMVVLLTILTNIVMYVYFFNQNIVDSFNSSITLDSRMVVEFIRFFSAIFFIIISFWLVNSYDRFIKSIYFFILGSLIQALYGVLEFFLKWNGITYFLLNDKSVSMSNIIRSYGTFFEPSQFGIFIGGSLLLYLVFLKIGKNSIYAKSILYRNVKTVIFIYMLALLFSLSRAAFIAIFIALLPYFFKNLFKFKFYFAGLLIFIGIYFFLDSIPFLQEKIEKGFSLTESDYENTLLNRIFSVLNLLYQFNDRLIDYPLGVGTGISTLLYGHSGAVFKIIFELGLITSLLFGWIFMNLLYAIIKTRYYKIELISLLIFLSVALVNYDSYVHIWIYFMLFVIYSTHKFEGNYK